MKTVEVKKKYLKIKNELFSSGKNIKTCPRCKKVNLLKYTRDNLFFEICSCGLFTENIPPASRYMKGRFITHN